jgi:hypothetical protein
VDTLQKAILNFIDFSHSSTSYKSNDFETARNNLSRSEAPTSRRIGESMGWITVGAFKGWAGNARPVRRTDKDWPIEKTAGAFVLEEQFLDEEPEFWRVATGAVQEGTAFFGTTVQRRTK